MATKIVQNVNRISPTVSVAATSNPIALKSGYLRVSTGLTGVYVESGGNPIVTVNSYYVPPYTSEILKERIARQQIAGITTGSTTIVTFGENCGNPFIVGDYVAIENASPAGINTNYALISDKTDSTVTINYNSTSITGVAVTASTLSRAVKVGSLADGASTNLSITEVVQLVSE
jgi:hypothetical protein